MSIDDLAAAALPRFGLSENATATLCNVSENHTYRVEDGESVFALRVHRPGYRTAQQIEAELHWVDALREDGAVDTCVPVPAPTGERVLNVHDRNVVLWEWLPGAEPDPEGDAVLDGFRVLGAVSARMHAHARAWSPPAGFDRPAWDYDHTLGADGWWGRWQDGLGMGSLRTSLLHAAPPVIRSYAARRLASEGPARTTGFASPSSTTNRSVLPRAFLSTRIPASSSSNSAPA